MGIPFCDGFGLPESTPAFPRAAPPFGGGAAASGVLAARQSCGWRMSVITNDHWTILVQCTMMVPVSSIFLQENRFKPANRGLFFIQSLRIPFSLRSSTPVRPSRGGIFHSAE
jgi:hypothetical protein